jgi:hypothetical protein
MTICFIFGLSSCQKDVYDAILSSKRKFKIERRNFLQLMDDKTFRTAFKKITKIEPNFNNQSRTALEEIYGFRIIPNVNAKVIIEQDGTKTYNILIEKGVKENLKFKNLIIREKQQITEAWIKEYTLSQAPVKIEQHDSYHLEIISENLEPLVVDGITSKCEAVIDFHCTNTGGGGWSSDHEITDACTDDNFIYCIITFIGCGGGQDASDGSIGNNDPTGGNSANGSNSATGGNIGNTGNQSNSNPIMTSPVLIENEPVDPCSALNKILQQPTSLIPGTVSLKSAMQTLKNRQSLTDDEEGFNFYYNATTNQMYATPAHQTAFNMVEYDVRTTVFGGDHFHQDGLQPMFSHDDIATLQNFSQVFGLPSCQSNPNYPAPMHLMTSEFGVYAIMIDDPELFANTIHSIYDDPNSESFDNFYRKIESLYNLFFNPFTNTWTGTYEDYELAFLKFITNIDNNNNYNLGISLYKAEQDLSGWKKLTIQSVPGTNNFQIIPINCN